MRILQVCNKPPYPPRDGGSLAMFTLASALRNLGHEITVLTMFTEKHRLTVKQYAAFSRLMNVHSLYVDTAVKKWDLLMNLLFSDLPYTATRFQSDEFENELIQILNSGKYDIVQLEGLYLTSYIPAVRKHSDARIVLRAHNVEHEIWERIAHEEMGLLRKWYFRVLAKRLKHFECGVMNQYDLIVPITGRDLEKFIQMGNKKPAHVCQAGVDVSINGTESIVAPDLIGPSFSLFYLGSLDWIPNQEGLIWFVSQVFPGIRQQFPDVKLHVAGRNAPPYFSKKLELPGIVFHGEIDNPEEFTLGHSVMVAPCFSGGGMRLKIVEAMALGKPVVTTSIGAEGLSVTNGKDIMIADDVEGFHQSLERLMKYPDICKNMGSSAFEFVLKYHNNHNIAVSLTAFYNQHLK